MSHAEMPGKSLSESWFTPPDVGQSRKNNVAAALMAALVVASVVGLESAYGSVGRVQVPAGCGMPPATVSTSDLDSTQKTINDYVAGVF